MPGPPAHPVPEDRRQPPAVSGLAVRASPPTRPLLPGAFSRRSLCGNIVAIQPGEAPRARAARGLRPVRGRPGDRPAPAQGAKTGLTPPGAGRNGVASPPAGIAPPARSRPVTRPQ